MAQDWTAGFYLPDDESLLYFCEWSVPGFVNQGAVKLLLIAEADTKSILAQLLCT